MLIVTVTVKSKRKDTQIIAFTEVAAVINCWITIITIILPTNYRDFWHLEYIVLKSRISKSQSLAFKIF